MLYVWCSHEQPTRKVEISPVFPIDIDISNEYRGQTVS